MVKLGELGDQQVDMTKWFNFTTFDVMSDLTFGQPLGLLRNTSFTPWVDAIFNLVKLVPVFSIVNYYPILKYAFKWLETAKVKDMRTSHFRHTADRVDMRLERGSGE